MIRGLVTIRHPGVLRWFGWKDPLPRYVSATLKLWWLWRLQPCVAGRPR